MKYRLRIVIVILCFLTAACGGQTGGFAPTAPLTQSSVTDISAESHFKLGETIASTNSWEVSIDTTDPVEQVLLANGWNVEVRFE